MHSGLISLPLEQAEKLLKEKGENYIIKKVGTFKKLPVTDTEAVINVKEENEITVLYVCGFMCGIYDKGKENAQKKD